MNVDLLNKVDWSFYMYAYDNMQFQIRVILNLVIPMLTVKEREYVVKASPVPADLLLL